MNALQKVRPAFMCAYAGDEGKQEAIRLCAALVAYGIKAYWNPYKPDYNPDREWTSYAVYVENEADRERAKEFKRGLLATLAIKGSPAAFIDGIMVGAKLRGTPKTKRPQLVKKGLFLP